MAQLTTEPVNIRTTAGLLAGDLVVPPTASAVVLFAHGSGSSRHSPRNRAIAESLQDNGFATLLLDLLTPAEELTDQRTQQLRFDIDLLADRLTAAIDWLDQRPDTGGMPVGLFGASTGAAAALRAATARSGRVPAVVSRGGRPDLAGDALSGVRAPTLLIVGGDDREVLRLNRHAKELLTALPLTDIRIEIVPHAGHLFEEPGALDQVADHATTWFRTYLATSTPRPPGPHLKTPTFRRHLTT